MQTRSLVLVLLVLAAAAAPASPGRAQEKTFGAWTVGLIKPSEGVFAATINESGGVLGQHCYRELEKCVWLLANDTTCEDGARYPVLVNADSGAASTHIRCLVIDGKPRYVFESFEVIDDAVRTASWFGIAFPMKSGRFQVSRFSMNGAAAAMALLREAAELMVAPASQRQGTRDESF